MKKKIILSAFLIIVISILVLVLNKNTPEPVSQQPEQDRVKEFVCPIEELRLDDLPDFAKNNETVKNIMIDNCYWAIASQSDPDKDGSDEIILETVGYLCGSCHAQDIYIIDEDRVSFEYSGEDLNYSITDDGFSIREPVRKLGESYADPSESKLIEYIYSEDSYTQIRESILKNQE